MREKLPALSYDRPVSVLMAFVALLVDGVIAFNRIPVQMMAEGFEVGFLYVQVPYGDASPSEVDEQIVRVVEAELSTVAGVAGLSSNANSGGAGFGLSFHQSTDLEEAYNSVVDRMERALPNLPEEVERYWIWRWDPNDTPILWAGVQLSEDIEDPYYVMTRVVQPRLERIPGVASLEVFGVPERSVFIDYDKERTYAHGVDLGDVRQKLRSDNFQASSGQLEDRGLIRNARSLSRIDGVDGLRQYPIKEGVVLGDIADVQMRAAMSADISRINGQEAAALSVKKESSANTVEVTMAVEEALRELEADPRVTGANFFVFFSEGDLVMESVNTLTNTAMTGGFFAVLILYLFLREWKMTTLIAASIPFSLLITIGILYFRGDSLNLLTLMGLMLAVGMVVDNAIVVVETIYRRRAEGESVRGAAIFGTAEVNLAIILSTLTTMVVFLPVILMSDNAMVSFFMGQLGLPVVFALGASLVVALIFAPLATRFMGRASIKQDPPWLKWMAERYRRLLSFILTRRMDAAMALLAMGLLTFGVAIPGVKCTGQPIESLNDFNIRFTVAPQLGISDRDKVVSRFENLVEEQREEWGVSVYRSRLNSDSSRGTISVSLETDGPMDRKDVMDAARELLPKDIPGVQASIGWEGGGEAGAGSQQIGLQITGEDVETMQSLGEEVVRRAATVPGILEANLDVLNDGADELRLRVDREAAGRKGVSAATIGQTLAWSLRGASLPELVSGEREIRVSSRFELEDRDDLDTLLNFEVWSQESMSLVPIRTLTSVEMAKGPGSIRRQDRQTGIGVTLDLEEGVSQREVYAGLDAALEDMAFPRGYGWSKGMDFSRESEDDDALYLAMLLSVVFVFLLMGVLFESWILPMSIITTIPMAMMGAFWGLYITDTGMDTMAGIGLVILVGVVVNNGIVLVDLVEQLRASGLERNEALTTAGFRRLRPILMTALTTICGLMPMALGDSEVVGIPYAPLGRTVIGGMIAGTLLTLLFVPFLYTLLDDLRGFSRTWLAYVRRTTT